MAVLSYVERLPATEIEGKQDELSNEKDCMHLSFASLSRRVMFWPPWARAGLFKLKPGATTAFVNV